VDFDVGHLLATLAVSAVGFVLLSYGKKMSRGPHALTGLILLVFPYFVPNLWLLLGVAGVLCFGLWFLVRQGW
jgi:hypothetical protein